MSWIWTPKVWFWKTGRGLNLTMRLLRRGVRIPGVFGFVSVFFFPRACFHLIFVCGIYDSPSKTSKTKGSESIQELRTIASAIQSATCVLIVGGGPVGIETAGEIATDYPTKSVTLIHSGSALMPGPTSDKFKSKVLTALRKKGVEVVLGERVEGLEGLFPDPVEKGWAGNGRDIVKVKTDKGREVGADVVVLATGNARYNSGFVKRLGEGLLEREQIRVRPTVRRFHEEWLRVFLRSLIANTCFFCQLQLDDNRLSNIFAIGDVTNIPLKFAYYAGEQGTIAADNIVKLISKFISSISVQNETMATRRKGVG